MVNVLYVDFVKRERVDPPKPKGLRYVSPILNLGQLKLLEESSAARDILRLLFASSQNDKSYSLNYLASKLNSRGDIYDAASYSSLYSGLDSLVNLGFVRRYNPLTDPIRWRAIRKERIALERKFYPNTSSGREVARIINDYLAIQAEKVGLRLVERRQPRIPVPLNILTYNQVTLLDTSAVARHVMVYLQNLPQATCTSYNLHCHLSDLSKNLKLVGLEDYTKIDLDGTLSDLFANSFISMHSTPEDLEITLDPLYHEDTRRGRVIKSYANLDLRHL